MLIALWAGCGPVASQISTEFRIPTDASLPHGIVSGPDGALWFTETEANPRAHDH
jgi:streptogramin lyase